MKTLRSRISSLGEGAQVIIYSVIALPFIVVAAWITVGLMYSPIFIYEKFKDRAKTEKVMELTTDGILTHGGTPNGMPEPSGDNQVSIGRNPWSTPAAIENIHIPLGESSGSYNTQGGTLAGSYNIKPKPSINDVRIIELPDGYYEVQVYFPQNPWIPVGINSGLSEVTETKKNLEATGMKISIMATVKNDTENIAIGFDARAQDTETTGTDGVPLGVKEVEAPLSE